MYTIIMDKYKNLNTTVRTSLFQQESLVDKIQFLVPPTYDGIDMSDYVVTLKYVDPNGNFHAEALTKDAETYKDYLRYVLPVTTKLTAVAGSVNLRLTFLSFDMEDPTTTIVEKMQTNSTTLIIQQPDGFKDYVTFEDLEGFKAQVAEIAALKDTIPNDVKVGKNEILHLVRDDEKIGEGVEILMPTEYDNFDDARDGIIDVDNIQPDPPTPPTPSNSFIEV